MAKVINWVIYVLRNPLTNEVRYVGWTSQNPRKRFLNHFRASIYSPNTHRAKWILSLLSIGLEPVMEVVESGIGDGWNEAERRWIAHYRATGSLLVNATEGGEGCLGRIASADTREKLKASPEKRAKMSASHKGKPSKLTGKALPPEVRAKISASLTGIKRSQEAIAKRLQHKDSAETRAKKSTARKRWLAEATTPEERSAAAKNAATKQWAVKTPAERSAAVKTLLEKRWGGHQKKEVA
jgi:hypothetical protein